jgi:hypothetical protein
MAIPVVIMVLTVLALLIMSYSRSLSASHRQVKRIQLGTMCSHLGVGCANVIAKFMEKEAGSIYEELSRGYTSCYSFLIEKRIEAGKKEDIPIPAANLAKYEQVLREMVATVELNEHHFVFEGLRVYFDDVSRIVTFEEPTFSLQDMVEKQGFLSIEVTISTFQGIKVTKAVKIKRPFKVVNLLPPILSRFCLFVAHTPHAETYNTVQHAEDGNPNPVPLLIQGGSQPTPYSSPPQLPPDGLDLQLGGWVYLGPTAQEEDDNIHLNMAEGYSGRGAQMFLFGKNPGDSIMRYSTRNPPGLRHWLNDDPYPVVLFQRFEGINTIRQATYNSEKVFGAPIPLYTSWLQPYGDAAAFARTLVVGPVLGRVLKIMQFAPFGWEIDDSGNVNKISDPAKATLKAWEKRQVLPATPPDFETVLPPVISALHEAVKTQGGDVTKLPNLWKDIFTIPARYVEYASREMLIPFNQFFDLVRHPQPPVLNVPSWFYVGLDPNDQTHIIPDSVRGFIQTVYKPAPQLPPAAYLARDHMTFGYTQGGTKDFFQFSGDLTHFARRNLVPALFEGRATRKLTLSGSSDSAEAESFRTLLLSGGKNLTMQGIILIIRSPGNIKAGPLVLPSDLVVHQNVVLVFDRGDIRLDGMTSTAPDKHATLVLLDGSLHLTEKMVEAYLIALKPPIPGSPSPPGHLVSADGGALQVTGGIAVYELGIPPPGDPGWSGFFRRGGKVSYNHTFNPCNYWYEDYYGLFMADVSPFLEVTEP